MRPLRKTSILFFPICALALAWPLDSLRAELPSIKVPAKYLACTRDADCAIAGDACRSCGEPVILNRKYLKWFDELDQKMRREKNFVISCEACSLERVKVKCVRKKCARERPPAAQ